MKYRNEALAAWTANVVVVIFFLIANLAKKDDPWVFAWTWYLGLMVFGAHGVWGCSSVVKCVCAYC